MRMHLVEAGSRLAGRFVLVDALVPATTLTRTSGTPDSSATPDDDSVDVASSWWRGHDELLSRRVAIRLLAPGPHADLELAAARSAARLTDPQIARVLDVGISDDLGYVVTEWVEGSDLATEVLRTGPLPTATAIRVAVMTARTLATVEAAGLEVPLLSPADIRLLDDDGIRVTGIELPADAATPSLEPSCGARVSGAVLYAALTGRWPLAGPAPLPPAPLADGVVLRPRRVRGGVPAELDAIAAAALGLPDRPASVGVLATAQDVARALETLTEDDLPDPDAHTAGVPGNRHHSDEQDDFVRLLAPGRGASRVAAAVRVGAIGLLLAGGGLVAWQASSLVRSVASGGSDKPRPAVATSEGPSVAALRTATLVPGVSSYDPPPGGDGEEHPGDVAKVLDDDPATSWATYHYKTAAFGGLKPGVGLLLDLHGVRDLASVTVDVGPAGGATDVELHVFDSRPDGPLSSGAVARRKDASGQVVLTPDVGSKPARWAVVWFTRLPRADTDFQVSVSHLVVDVRSVRSGGG